MMDETETALSIIAGIQDPYPCWDVFFAKPKPAKRDDEGRIAWRERVCYEIRWAAIRHVAARLEGR